MARKQLTAKQKKDKADKMRATKAANKLAALDAIGYKAPKKIRKKRKPPSPEQHALMVQRLAKAREKRAEARAAKGLTTGTAGIHSSIVNLPAEHQLSPVKVKMWLKKCKTQLAEMRSFKDSKSSSERSQYQTLEVYVGNLGTYLRTGVWLDCRWGADREHIMHTVVYTPAFELDGTMKRTKGHYYHDIGTALESSIHDVER